MRKSILITALIAGTCDIIAACTNAYLSAKVMPAYVLRFVASGAFGKAAFTGGSEMPLMGLLFHFIIALACTATFYWAYPKLAFLKHNVFLNAILIGVVAWIVTTQIIIRMSQITPAPFNFSKALVAMAILVVCIGLPIAFRAKADVNRIRG